MGDLSGALRGRCARVVCALAVSCASGRRAPTAVTNATETRAFDASTATAATATRDAGDAGAAVAARASDPRDPPQSRREVFRGCGIAVPDDATREAIDMGMRVSLQTDTGELVNFGVSTRSWSAGSTIDWTDYERGLRNGVSNQSGVFIYFRAPLVAGAAAEAAWRLHQRVERRERGRFFFSGRRYAVVSCAAPRDASDEVERACDAAIESLSLSREDAPRPDTAPAGRHWTGARGIYAQTPDAWLPQNTGDGAISVVETRGPRSPVISVNGGEITQPVAQVIAGMRAEMERDGVELASWEIRRTAAGTKIDYDGMATPTADHFIRQHILIDGWRMCVATCAGPEDFVVSDESFCAHWLPTLRVER